MISDLDIKFGDVLQTPTIFPERQGEVEVIVTNQGDQAVTQPFDIKLYASTDPELDNDPDNPLNTLGDPITGERGANDPLEGTDELLGTLTISDDDDLDDLNPGQSKTLTLDFADEFRTASVVSPGAYFLIAEVDSNEDSNADNDIAEGENSQFISTDGTDVVLDWNSTLLNAIQASGKGDLAGTPPPLAARNAAIVHTAIYDAVRDASGAGASPEAAAVGAAYQTLVNLYPDPAQRADFDSQRIRSLDEIPDDTAEDEGFALGVDAANQILAQRENDGAAEADDIPYTAPPTPGVWRPTPTRGETTPDEGEALLPGWQDVTPFAITSVEDVLPDIAKDGPPELGTPRYALAVNLVKNLGSRDSKIRTDNLTEIAQFWAYDRPDTFGPTGQWQEIAQEVALEQGNTLEENARLFAQLTTAMADAGIAAWDLKYNLGGDDSLGFNQWRPITAIREADTDPNLLTRKDENWEPLLDTPPFPDYVSGHAIFGAAAGRVLRNFYDTNNISFDIPSQELPGESRPYRGFRQAVVENALSRVYGGVHIGEASLDGVIAGIAVGEAVADSVI